VIRVLCTLTSEFCSALATCGYPYKEFKAELSKKSQVSLERDYKAACTTGRMVVFVRDIRARKLVSYTISMTA
jgi:hypothetical protein